MTGVNIQSEKELNIFPIEAMKGTKANLNKSVFPVERPGDNICGDWKLFFFNFRYFFPKKDLCVAEWPYLFFFFFIEANSIHVHFFGHLLDRKQTFFFFRMA